MPTEDAQVERSKVSAGHRRINAIWETTQATIALGVIGVTLYVDAKIALAGIDASAIGASSQNSLNVMSALVTGFYFGRTNHTQQGGVPAAKPSEER